MWAMVSGSVWLEYWTMKCGSPEAAGLGRVQVMKGSNSCSEFRCYPSKDGVAFEG